jgi:hypothetical protein
MSYKLLAFLSLIRQLRLCELFEILIAVKVYPVPELGPAMVEIIDGVKVQVLFVPPKHGLPGANIDVGCVHT